MKLRTTIGALTDAFAITSPTLDKKGSSANLYLNANEKSGFLYLYSTNLASETATKIPIESSSVESGEVLVNPSKLADGLSGLGRDTAVELSLTPTGNSLRVQAGNVKFSLAASTAVRELGERMKSIPSKSTPIANIPVTELLEFTKRSTFCIPNDQTGQRVSLSALKLVSTEQSGEEAYATDGAIAVRVSSPTKQGKGSIGEKGILIPVVALQPLTSLASKRKKGETVALIMTEQKNRLFFKFADGTHFGTLTLNANYPDLKPIIERQSKYSFEISREELKQALGRASAFVSSVYSKRIVELELGIEQLAIKANGDDNLSDTIAIEYKGQKPTEVTRLGMNIDNIFNIASASKSEKLTFSYNGSNEPLTIIDSEGEEEERINIKYVMMGVRLATS